MMTALTMDASTGLLNVVLGVLYPSTLLIYMAHIVLVMIGMTVSIIVNVAKQLELNQILVHHTDASIRYGELHMMIRSELFVC